MASINYFESDMSNSTNTIVHFDEKGINLGLRLRTRSHTMYTLAGWFYLSPCEIRAADNSSTCAVMTEKTDWWNSCNNNIVFARRPYERGLQSVQWSGALRAKK